MGTSVTTADILVMEEGVVMSGMLVEGVVDTAEVVLEAVVEAVVEELVSSLESVEAEEAPLEDDGEVVEAVEVVDEVVGVVVRPVGVGIDIEGLDKR